MEDSLGRQRIAFILDRHSQGIKHLRAPGPTDADLALMVEAALAAPDHAALVPFRFKLVREDARDSLAQLFARVARSAGKTEAGVAMEEERARRAPVILAVVARLDMGHPLVPVHEQWVAIGGAITNFLNAAHALGFAGKMLSGAKVRHPDVVAAFCESGEMLLGWISLGTAVKRPDARRAEKPSAASLIQTWRVD